MKPILVWGTVTVNFALISYSIGIISEQRLRKITTRVLLFLTIGVTFDIIATACMITGSENSPFTLHGILGYSSLTGMLVDTVLVWRHRLRKRENPVPVGLHQYSRYAYIWWVLAYVTGATMVMMSRV